MSGTTSRRNRARLCVEPLEERTLLSADIIPAVISRDGLGLGYITSMAVSPDGHKVYLGRAWSTNPERLNLGVLTLDDFGNPVGDASLYADSADPLPLDG